MADTNLATLCLNIANAIRSKRGTTDKIKPIDFPAEIAKIGSGGTADASKVVSGYSIYTADGVVVGTFAPIEANLTPATTEVTFTAPDGQWISKATVSAVTSAIDSNIIAGNIKKGVTILGVTGTLEEGTGLVRINYHLTNCQRENGTSGFECIDIGDTFTPSYFSALSGYTMNNATAKVLNNGEDYTSMFYSTVEVGGVTYGKISGFVVNGTIDITISAAVDVQQLPTPSNITLSGNTLSWSAVTNATSYKIKLVTTASTYYKEVTSTSLDLSTWSDVAIGTNYLSVQALSTSENWSASEFTSSVAYTKTQQLTTPTLTIASGGGMSWTTIANATKYKVVARQNGTSKFTLETTDTSTTVKTVATTKGTYDFTVQALGTSPYLDSAESNSVSYTITNPLSAPTNVTLHAVGE